MYCWNWSELIQKYRRLRSLSCAVNSAACRLLFGEFEKLWKAAISSVMSVRLYVRPHGTTRLPLDGFSWKFILGNSGISVDKIQVSLKSYKNNGTLPEYQHTFLSYLAQFFLEWEMFRKKVVEKIKTHILRSITFFRTSRRLWDNMEKYFRTRQATDDNMAHALWMLDT